MSGMDSTIAARLGLQAAQDGGFVGDRGGALVHASHLAGPPATLQIVVTVRSLSGDLPALDGALADLAEAGELSVEKAGSAATMAIADPESYDPEALADALAGWIDALVAADLVPQVKCDSCMVRDDLAVVARDGRAIRQCTNCLSRAGDDTPGLRAPAGIPASAAGMASPAAHEPTDDPSFTISPSSSGRADGDHGTAHYLMRAALFLPLAAIASAFVWLALWYAWDGILERMADDEGNVSIPQIGLIIVGAIIGSLTSIPLAVAIRKSRIYSFVTTWVPAVIFGLAAIVLGEAMELIRWAHAEEGVWDPLVVIHLWSYWTSFGGFYMVTKVIFAAVTVYFAASFSDPTSSED